MCHPENESGAGRCVGKDVCHCLPACLWHVLYVLYVLYVSACLKLAQAQSSFCSRNCGIMTLCFCSAYVESFIRTAEYSFLRLKFMHVGDFFFFFFTPFFCSMAFFKWVANFVYSSHYRVWSACQQVSGSSPQTICIVPHKWTTLTNGYH